ncbi:MAG: MBL fold metallo-hydrolase [Clostridia bacterium]
MNFITIFADNVKPVKLCGTGTFNPHKTAIVDEHLSCIHQKDVNIWFYRKNDTIIAIDSGYHTENSFFEDLKTLKIINDDIKAVFLTHGDVDHMGGLLSKNRFAKNAKVYLNEKEESMILGTAKRFGKGFIKIKNPVKFTGEYEVFKDNAEIFIENVKIQTFLCCGHTKGHTCYLFDDKYLFTGDSIAVNENGGHCFFNFYNMDTKESILSLNKLKNKLKDNPPSVICTSHNGIASFEDGFSKIDTVAKASKSKPFDKTGPYDVFKD